MSSSISSTTILAIHPGAELFGSDRMFLESVIGLIEGGHHVVVALPEAGDLALRLSQEGALVTIAPMLVLRKSLLRPKGWGKFVRDSLRNVGSGWRLLLRYRPSVVYVSTLTLPLWPVLGWARGARVVSHIHEAESTTPWLVQKAIYMPHKLAATVIVNSRFTRNTLHASLPSLAKKAEVIYNGVAPPLRIVPPRPSLHAPFRVLYVGRLSPRKGLSVALDAVHLLRARQLDVHMTFLGSVFEGYEWYEDELHEQITRLRLDEHVEFAGFDPDIWHRLSAADVVIVPSIQDESFGNTAVEGILARRPVVASDTSGLREAAGGYGSAMLVTPKDPTALSDALLSIFQDWSRIASMTESTARDAEARHSVAGYRSRVAAATIRDDKHEGQES